MSTKNLSAILYGINDLRLEERPIFKPKSNQVLIKIATVGICGSDVHYLVRGRIGPFILEAPMIIGHEASGTVVEIGENVTNLKCGDRVAIEPGVSCRTCDFCRTGRYNLCTLMAFCATPPFDGNLQRYYVHDANFCYKLPTNVSLDEGALMEPLSVGVHACRKANVNFSSICLIMGAGPIGLVTMMAAKAMGAPKILIVDVAVDRLNIAKQLGADFILHTQPRCNNDNEDGIVENIVQILGEQPHISFECSGAEICNRIALKAIKASGTMVLVGMGPENISLPLVNGLIKEVNIKGTFRYCNDYPVAIELVKSGKINVKPLVTHHFKLEDTLEAFNVAISGKGQPIKILIHANTDWKPN